MILFPIFAPHHHYAPKTKYLANLKSIGTAISLYMNDNDEKFPNAAGFGPAFHTYDGRPVSRYLFDAPVSKSFANYKTDISRPGSGAISGNGIPAAKARFLPNLLVPYAKSDKIWICPVQDEEAEWVVNGVPIKIGDNCLRGMDKRFGRYSDQAADLMKKVDTQGLGDQILRHYDPPTSYMFNAWVRRADGSIFTISGARESTCEAPGDAPLVWDAVSGYAPSPGKPAQFAHTDSICVLYVDGHTKAVPLSNAPPYNASSGSKGQYWGNSGWKDVNRNGKYDSTIDFNYWGK